MRIKADEMIGVLRRQIQDYDARLAVEEVGTIVEVGDGIARVYGLENCLASELVQFPNDVFGMALNLEEDNVGVIILGDYEGLKEGDTVKGTGRIIQVPVGEALLGSNPGLLAGGMWGTVKLWYRPEVDPKHPVEISAFTPFQVDVTTVADVIQARKEFTTEEWIRLLLSSAGYDAARLRNGVEEPLNEAGGR